MEHAVHFGHVQQSVSNRRQIDHRLVLRQEPNRSRMCGIGEKDRRPVDPPPIIQLHVNDPATANNRVYLHNPYYFMYATLMDEQGERELNTLSDKKARTMTGSVVASLAHLKDIDGNDGAFFVFPDLSVRCEGIYRLKFSLFEIVGNQVFFCKSIMSTMFNVYSAKKFPGMEESTRLTKLFAEQGLKIRVRKEQKTGRPKGARSRPIATALHSDSAPPPPPPPPHAQGMSTWGVGQRAAATGSMSFPGIADQQQPPPPYSAASVPTASASNPSSLRPTPPGSWSSMHMQPAHSSTDPPHPHSPQRQHYPQPPPSQGPEHQRVPFQHQAADYPRSIASAPGSQVSAPQHHHLPAVRPQNMLYTSHPYASRLSGTSQSQHHTFSAGDYPDQPLHPPQARSQALPPLAYQPYSAYRQPHAGDESPHQQQQQPYHHSAGHSHRPWSPHHRTPQHYSPAPPGHAFAGDSRYSPYNRVTDIPRESRQPAAASNTRVTGIASSSIPAGDGHGMHIDHMYGRPYQPQHPRALHQIHDGPQYYQLAAARHQRMSSSTPETPSRLSYHGQPLHRGDRRYSAHQPPPQQHLVVESPSPASASVPTAAAPVSSSATHGSGLHASTPFGSPPPPSSSAAPGPSPQLASVSPQRRIAVHSLLVSDSSSSPERT